MKRALLHNGNSRVRPGLRTGARALLRHLPVSPTLKGLFGRRTESVPMTFARRPVHPGSIAARMQRSACILLPTMILLFALAASAMAATLPGTLISNIAKANFVRNNQPLSTSSNRVDTAVRPLRTSAVIELLQQAPGVSSAEQLSTPNTQYSSTGLQESNNLQTIPPPVPLGQSQPIPIDVLQPLLVTGYYHPGQVIFIKLTDGDQNLSYLQRDTVWVTITCQETGDRELLLLTETTINSGVFAGYLPSAALNGGGYRRYDGLMHLKPGSRVQAEYLDPYHAEDRAYTDALVDPLGKVFNSQTGAPVDGAEVTLIDVATNLPATVLGDDGFSSYPATLISGGSIADSSGTLYEFEPGRFRYPFIAPGLYRLEISPPQGYSAPSEVQAGDLQRLPGAPFAIGPGSYGETFNVVLGPVFQIDIPVDPAPAELWVQKESNKSVVAPGDFVTYTIKIENPSEVSSSRGITLTDTLPRGLRYQAASLQRDGITIADPQIDATGRTMTLSLGDLAAEQSVELRYVAAIGTDARLGEAVNRAYAQDAAGKRSNTAEARIRIREELIRSRAIIMGRVMANECSVEDTEQQGLANARIYLEDGTSVVTDEEGNYHIEGVLPGLHVAQLDLHSLPPQYEVTACEENTQFAQRSFSQFIDVQGASMWRADFHVNLRPKATGDVSLALTSTLVDDIAALTLPIDVGGVPLRNLRLTVLLPKEISYLPASSLLNDVSTADPNDLGGSLIYRLGDQPADWQGTLQLRVRVNQSVGQLPLRAMLTFDSPEQQNQRTAVADNLIEIKVAETRTIKREMVTWPHFPSYGTNLSAEDKGELDALAEQLKGVNINHLIAVGHTDNVPIAARNLKVFPNNFALGEARAKSVADYLAQKLELSAEKISQTSMGATTPIAENSSEAGRARNRRVELRVYYEEIESSLNTELVKADSGILSTGTIGLRPGESWANDQAKKDKEKENKTDSIDVYNKQWLKQAPPGTEWLWPGNGHYPSIPSTRIAIKHHPREKPVLMLNGEPVSGLNFDGAISDDERMVAISFWRGVDLKGGANKFEVLFRDASGRQTGQLEHVVQYAQPPVHAEFLPEDSTLLADGSTPPQIAFRLTDEKGHPAREGVVGQYRVNDPYAAFHEEGAGPVQDGNGQELQYTIGKDGIAIVKLRPTTQAGKVTLQLRLFKEDQEITAWLNPGMRDWILVGFAQGTVGYNLLSNEMESLQAGDIEEHGYYNGEVKFFAKGTIKGKWLLTLAYDSDKRRSDDQGLYQTIDPDAYYTLYGDESSQQYEASSSEKLFIKLERDQFYAMFGDFNTGLTNTDLALYSRSLTGLKSEFNSERIDYTVFVSDTRQLFIKDELAGNGTSGLYRLTNSQLLVNSEKVTIETRDRFRSEKIISTLDLNRHSDYEIDYNNGSLFFKRPIPSKDENFNPVYIMIRYEVSGNNTASLNYGGRAAYRTPDQSIEIGASYIHEDRGDIKGDLGGVDATIKLAQSTSLRVEAAVTEKQGDPEQDGRGTAYLAEITHKTEQVGLNAYYRQEGDNFGIGQQNASESGTRKYGFDASYLMSKNWRISGEAYRQYDLASSDRRDMATLTSGYQGDRFGFDAGLRQAQDQLGAGESTRSLLLLTGANWLTADKRLKLKLNNEQTITTKGSANTAFPNRLIAGGEYRLNAAIDLFAEQEFTWGDEINSQGTRAGLRARPWEGGQLHTSLERQMNESDQRVFALFGLYQTWQLTEHWSFDFSIDNNRTISKDGQPVPDNNLTTPTGTGEDFTAVSVGATYKLEKWSWWNRLETRKGDNETSYGVSTSVVGEPRKGLAFSAKAQLFIANSTGGSEKANGNLRLGMAYRPAKNRWIVLNRFDYYFEKNENGVDNNSWRIINNLTASYKPNRKLQLSIYYGFKYVNERIGNQSYHAFTDLIAFESRYNLTSRWDIGIHSSILHSWDSQQYSYSLGADIGYSPVTNTWISLGYNIVGFEDEDFSATNYTAEGAYMRFRAKFDQQSVRDAAAWINR